MSGFDFVIYIAGLILLTKVFMKELIGLVMLSRRLLSAARDPLPPPRQFDASDEIRSNGVSDLATRKSDE